MGCGCQPGIGTWDAYIACGQVAPQPLAPDSVLQQYAAQAGAQSSNWTMCYAVAVLKTRRSIYWKASPGDCGAPGSALPSTTIAELRIGSGIGAAAAVDPEPISKGILSGLAAIFGGFTAHHAAAVANEQTVNCNVSTSFNYIIQQLEQAVKAGSLTAAGATTVLAQTQAQLDSVLASLAQQCNFSCGARIALRALVQFMSDIGFPALAPQSIIQALAPSPPVISPGAPGTYQVASPATGIPAGTLYPVPAGSTTVPSTYAGASGPIASPLTGNNGGVGVTSNPAVFSNLPTNIPVGAIVIIGGILYLVTKPGVAQAAAA